MTESEFESPYYQITAQHKRQAVLDAIKAQQEPIVHANWVADHIGRSRQMVQDYARELEAENAIKSVWMPARTGGVRRFYRVVDDGN